MHLHQLRSQDGTETLSYICVDEQTHNAVIIDPNKEDLNTITLFLKEQRAVLSQIIETHTHVDHISAANELKNIYPAQLIMHEKTKNKWRVIDEAEKFGIADTLRENAKLEIDRFVNDGETLAVDSMKFTFLHTPGHTDNHIAILIDDNIFTGDLLLIGQAGRSDLPGGNAEEQYESLTKKILTLPDATKIWPGHDYEENTFAYLRDEKKTNPFLQQPSKEAYRKFVADFFPPLAESIAGGKMTIQCGVQRVATNSEPFRSLSPDDLESLIKAQPNIFLLDVREPFELTAFGKIPGVVNISTRQLTSRLNELPQDKSTHIVCICQSGSRSYEVAHFLATRAGYSHVYNLEDGTSGWAYDGKPLERGTMKTA
ncbi:MAG: MBL fold metallo-hydrolase [Ignavibacteriales bacterium]|nr:MBL fold metallo-hydrolase [Ignavibacteriales bacterium]